MKVDMITTIVLQNSIAFKIHGYSYLLDDAYDFMYCVIWDIMQSSVVFIWNH